MDPLFPEDWQQADSHPQKGHSQEPANPAADLIRRKIETLYGNEPSVSQELTEVQQVGGRRSKHQEFMYRLSTSGQSLAKIQEAWHNYYANLPDHEKHEVWQEFYAASSKRMGTHDTPPAQAVFDQQPNAGPGSHPDQLPTQPKTDRRSIKSIKKTLIKGVKASGLHQIKAKEHLHSLLFGLGIGALALIITLFGLFNQVVITPFIKPGSGAGNTPIILSADTPAPSATPEVIIPKINVEIPVIYSVQSSVESDVEKGLESGVVHYPTTASPGSNGNAAFFGHSSNNIFNKGKYKFAFVLLHDLQPGDIFYLTYNKTVYTYKIYDKKIVEPSETWVLGPVQGKTATATLITCDPPGTSKHRLVVWGEQITPDPSGNSAAATPSTDVTKQSLPGNGPGPLTRFWRWLF